MSFFLPAVREVVAAAGNGRSDRTEAVADLFFFLFSEAGRTQGGSCADGLARGARLSRVDVGALAHIAIQEKGAGGSLLLLATMRFFYSSSLGRPHLHSEKRSTTKGVHAQSEG